MTAEQRLIGNQSAVICWVQPEALRGGMKLYPPEIIPCILCEAEGVIHFVYREI